MPATIPVLQVALPTDYDQGSDFAPLFNDQRYESPSMAFQVVSMWSGRFSRGAISYTNRDEAFFKSLFDLWAVCRQTAQACLLFDHKGYQGTDEPIGTGDGAKTSFQLRVRSLAAATSVYYPVKHPIHNGLSVVANGETLANTVTVKKNGVDFPAAGNWTVVETTGAINFTTPPAIGDVLTSSFKYLKAVIFEDRKFPARKEGVVWHVEGLRLIEVNG